MKERIEELKKELAEQLRLRADAQQMLTTATLQIASHEGAIYELERLAVDKPKK
ncbi:MAG: hypothetical protein U9M89_02830 [Patescibacteria group bacterium]|nr:hypothetical protein [Patescibacteria group bacterium]